MNFLNEIISAFQKAMTESYGIETAKEEILINITKKEFTGDYTIVTFPFTKTTKVSPEELGRKIGEWLKSNCTFVKDFNVIKGFLNLVLEDSFWFEQLKTIHSNEKYGNNEKRSQKVLVEFASPNTNKPIHLGHIRNILLGWSTSKILEADGYDVKRVQIINDRGIAICKSMLAWKKYGEGKTPEQAGIKGDHYVGDFYVMFENKFQDEYKSWQESEAGKKLLAEKNIADDDKIKDFFKGNKNNYFNQYSVIGKEARDMLLAWEANDAETINLWKMMNGWVYDGFETTYNALGVNFDKNYYESDTYLLGKNAVEVGLERGVFEQEADGSVWCDMTDVGMDRKIVLRSDGTSVYITQDIGTAMKRYEDFATEKMIYTVADEQDYHFKVLFEILKRLKEPYADGLYHLSYGMVDLTTGKMKSREGNVVDADDLIKEVIETATENSSERGELNELTKEDQEKIIRQIAMSALKYFIIKVQPKKRMTFNPVESLDMQGQTGPYIQNAFVRVKSLFRKGGIETLNIESQNPEQIEEIEKELIKLLLSYPEKIREASAEYDPSTIANFCYALAKEFHRYWHEVRILSAATEEDKNFRLLLCSNVGKVLGHGMNLLGIEMVERM